MVDKYEKECILQIMKVLPQTKIWSGDGYGTNPVTLVQLKRNETTAIYKRIHNEKLEGFEVFSIKIRHKGDKLPGGQVEDDDREVYPSANSFGKYAYACSTQEIAEKRYNELMGDNTQINEQPDPEPLMVGAVAISNSLAPNPTSHRGRPKVDRPTLLIPVGEFSTKELAEHNKVEYSDAVRFIKESGLVKFIRSERRNAKGKETNLFTKI